MNIKKHTNQYTISDTFLYQKGFLQNIIIKKRGVIDEK
jgi:hypothetical protein